MGDPDPTAARWTAVGAHRGHYESFYLRAVDPVRPRGVWIRYTVEVRPGARPTGQLWFTWFDRAADRSPRRPGGGRRTGHRRRLLDPHGRRRVRAVDGRRERARPGLLGGLDAGAHRRCSAAAPSAARWMYTARLPRTKLLSPPPTTRFTGALEVDGQLVELTDWPGMIGHNWGEQHAEEWIWLHGLGFVGKGADTWLDVAVGRVRLGPVTTPWIANGAISASPASAWRWAGPADGST